MQDPLHTTVTELASGEMLRIRNGRGRGVAVFDGLLWITHEGDERDIFLSRGDVAQIEHDGTTIVEALKTTRLVVCADGHVAPPIAAARQRPASRPAGRLATAIGVVVAVAASALLVATGEAEAVTVASAAPFCWRPC